MDTATIITNVTNIITALSAIAAATGFGAWAVSELKKNGVDVQATLNNKFVTAAERAAKAAITDVVVQGKSLTDPAVLSDVVNSLTTSLNASHAETVSAIGASSTDVARIAANAVKGAVADAAVPPAAPVVEPATAITAAQATITAAKSALGIVEPVKA